MDSVTEVRAGLIDFVRADLVGPAHGVDEIIEDAPYVKYAAGVLFPRGSTADESGSIGGVESGESDDKDSDFDPEIVLPEKPTNNESPISDSGEAGVYDDTVTLANRYKPSAIALTFAVPDDAKKLQVEVNAAEYDNQTEPSPDGKRQNQVWQRRSLAIDPIRLPLTEDGISHHPVADGLNFCLLIGRSRGRRIVTASLYNDSDAKTFYQCSFELKCVDPICEFDEYSDTDHLTVLEAEELSLEMMYRDRKSFAIGHGCAADWIETENGRVEALRTESVPKVVVPPVEPRSGRERYLSMNFLQGTSDDPASDIPKELDQLCADYERWIEQNEESAKRLPTRYEGVAAENLRLCRLALDRIRHGIATIERNPLAMEAFQLANRAILMQQYHSRLPVRSLKAEREKLPGWDDYPGGFWRTFQLAFLLMTIPGVVDETDSIQLGDEFVSSRDLVDLIWFPTGGGKTEAYLGLSAFLIFLTRLRDPMAHGCKVLMRYTLRLLTSQQFQRASSLICACELIRTREPDRLGETPISIGLWVGKSLTPNDERAALASIRKMNRGGTNPFQLLSCPWCGTTLTDPKKLGYVPFRRRQLFVCPNSGAGDSSCAFSSETNPLPVCVVDDSIYDRPPTLLIGTVDKFAMLAWRARSGEIFRVGGGPDLIIQDELHLISGPLGSMVGLYEGVIDFLCSEKARPKIVASTATIRRA